MEKYTLSHFHLEVNYPTDVPKALTTFLVSVRIVNSMRNPWPIFKFTYMIDNQDFIENLIDGTQDIQLKIWYTGEDGEKKGEPVTFELLFLEYNLDLPPKVADNMTDRRDTQRRYVIITCVPKPAYLTMTTFVNRLWQEEDPLLRPIDFLYEIFDLKEINRELITEDNVNEDLVNQLIIPPMTIKSAIDYIDEKFGIYKGPLFRYVNYSGQLLMWDLKKRYELFKPEGWTQHHKMPAKTPDKELYTKIGEEVLATDDNFINYENVETLNYPNSILSKYGYDITHIIHPHEDIAFFQKKNFDEIIEEYGIFHDIPEVKYHEIFKNRKVYYIDNKGFEIDDSYTGEYNDAVLTSRMAKDFMDMSSVRFSFFRNIKLHFCMKVGEALYLKPYSEHEKDVPGMNFEGAYLIETSDILFTREEDGEQLDNVKCQCTLTGFRSRLSKD